MSLTLDIFSIFWSSMGAIRLLASVFLYLLVAVRLKAIKSSPLQAEMRWFSYAIITWIINEAVGVVGDYVYEIVGMVTLRSILSVANGALFCFGAVAIRTPSRPDRIRWHIIIVSAAAAAAASYVYALSNDDHTGHFLLAVAWLLPLVFSLFSITLLFIAVTGSSKTRETKQSGYLLLGTSILSSVALVAPVYLTYTLPNITVSGAYMVIAVASLVAQISFVVSLLWWENIRLGYLAAEAAKGLTLSFRDRLTSYDRFLIDGVVYGVLGKDTNCRMEEFRNEWTKAVVRLDSEDEENLEEVADALWDRSWEKEHTQLDSSIIALRTLNKLQGIEGTLSDLCDKLEKADLRVLSKGAIERLEDLGEEHIRAEDLKLVRTWGQKALSAVGKRVAKELTEEGVDAVKDVVKGLVPGGDDGDEEDG